MSGYVIDFQIDSILPSIVELTPDALTTDPLALQSEQALTYANLALRYPSKKIVFYIEAVDSPKLRSATVLLFNRRPYLNTNVLPRLTKTSSLLVAPNSKIWVRQEEGLAGGGFLSGSDSVVIRLSASEEAPKPDGLPVSEPLIQTVILIEADTEYSVQLPEGTRRYAFKCRRDSGDPVADVRFSWLPGVAGPRLEGFDVLFSTAEESEQDLLLSDKRIYFASSKAGVALVVKSWH